MAATKESTQSKCDTYMDLTRQSNFDAYLDLTLRRLMRGSVIGGVAGLILLRRATPRFSSIALGAGLGMGSAYTECKYNFSGYPTPPGSLRQHIWPFVVSSPTPPPPPPVVISEPVIPSLSSLGWPSEVARIGILEKAVGGFSIICVAGGFMLLRRPEPLLRIASSLLMANSIAVVGVIYQMTRSDKYGAMMVDHLSDISRNVEKLCNQKLSEQAKPEIR